MRRIRSKDTAPELVVRRLLHSAGYRYRLHDARLPGKPDLVFRARKAAIFVHGCYWHGHSCKRGARIPKSNTPYWENKILQNKARDARAMAELELLGWRVLAVWECETKSGDLLSRLTNFLGEPRTP